MQDWQPRDTPCIQPTKGAFVRIDALRPALDGPELYAAIAGPGNEDLWRYIPFGPPDSPENLLAVLSLMADHQGWQTLVFRGPETARVLGMASYMRIRPEAGSAEVGAVVFSKALQKTAAATEAIYRMARHLFVDREYRRFEWKCDDENEASKRAALRFGFTAEGVFRQDMVVKGRNRDTAWFSMLDHEWPRLESAFTSWLAPENFDAAGRQRRSLADVRERPS